MATFVIVPLNLVHVQPVQFARGTLGGCLGRHQVRLLVSRQLPPSQELFVWAVLASVRLLGLAIGLVVGQLGEAGKPGRAVGAGERPGVKPVHVVLQRCLLDKLLVASFTTEHWSRRHVVNVLKFRLPESLVEVLGDL